MIKYSLNIFIKRRIILRLRRKPWIDEAILDFNDFVYTKGQSPSEEIKGH